MTKDGYPEEHELDVIKEWHISKWHKELDPFKLIDFIESITWTSEWCIKRRGKRIVYFEFHTAGWSGNEEIIEVLKSTFFWTLYWQKSIRGGHYYFKVYKLKNKNHE